MTAILGFARTPFAPINGALREVAPEKLGTAALVAASQRSGAQPASIARVFVGSVLTAGRGPNPARTLAVEAGWEEWDVGPYGLSIRAGGASGLEALALAGQAARDEEGDATAAAVGLDSSTLAPYLMPEARHGSRLGHARLLDAAHKDAWDFSTDELPLPAQAAVILQPLGLGRPQFVEARNRSVARARAAAGKGELTSIGATEDGKERTLDTDELAGERPLTPGDEAYAAFLADGAAAAIVASAATAKSLGRQDAPRILAWARACVEGHHAPKAPVAALAKLLRATNRRPSDLKVVEVDESLYVAPEIARRELEVPDEHLNPRGGAHAYGHAGGACGIRALVAGLAELEARGGGLMALSYGAGGGAAVALLIER